MSAARAFERKDSTILVTGGAGFIGANLLRYLLDQTSARLVVLDRLTYAGNRDSLPASASEGRFVFVEGDVCDSGLVDGLLRTHQPTALMHLAAESHVDRSILSPDEFLRTNVQGTGALLDAAKRYYESAAAPNFRFIQVSTDEVYGALGPSGKFLEDSPYRPNSPYAASKAAADHLVRAYSHTYGLPAIITRSSNNYGAWQHPEKLIPRMVVCALRGLPLAVYGSGQQVRDWLHVNDHCAGLLAALRYGVPGESYNFGASCEWRNLDVVLAICRLIDELRPDLSHRPCETLVEHIADRRGHDFRYAIDATKAHDQLGWEPKMGFEQGLRQTVQWYCENAAWVESMQRRQNQRP